jgi:hypothetical protein
VGNIEDNQLYELVKSLNKAEKTHFKKSAAGESNALYLHLFDVIDKTGENDTVKIKKQYLKKGSEANYTYTRHYLYNALMLSLNTFYANDSIVTQLNTSLNDVHILFKKGLFAQCRKLINKLKKTAQQQERFLMLLQLIPIEKKIIHATSYKDIDFATFLALDKEEADCAAAYNNLLTLSQLTSEMIYTQRTAGTPTGKNLHQLYDEVLNHPAMQEGAPLLSKKAAIQFYHNKATAYFGKRQFELALQAIMSNMDVLLANREVVKEEEDRLVSVINNLLVLCIDLRKHDVFDKYLAEMRKFAADKELVRNHNFQLRIFERSTALELRKLIDNNEWKTALQKAGEAEQQLMVWKEEIGASFYVNFCFLLTAIYYLNNDETNAHKWLRVMQHDTDANIRQDMHAYVRIIELLMSFDRGEYELCASIERSAERQFARIKQTTEVEQLLFTLFRNHLTGLALKTERKTLLKKFNADLQALYNNNIHSTPVIESVIGYWIGKNG